MVIRRRNRPSEPRDPEFQAALRSYNTLETLDERIALATAIRERSEDWAKRFDRWLLENHATQRAAIGKLESIHGDLQREIERLVQPPLHPAIFIGLRETSRGTLALVAERTGRRVVAFAAGIEPASIGRGREVLLGDHLNVIVEVTAHPGERVGETASFDRRLDDGRLVVRSRDDELVLDAVAELDVDALKRGDALLYDREQRLAFERVPSSPREDLFLEETPSTTFADIGGLDDVVEKMQQVVTMRIENPELAATFGLRAPRSMLLLGAPGCGKTLLARAFANWVAQRSTSGRCRFINVKPSEMSSMWFGESEANYRRVFAAARAASDAEPDVPVVIFFDEIDAVGAARGATLARVDDRVLQSLMVELDGLESRGNVLVLAATNRADALDPALVRPSRLGDLFLEVPRPGRQAAKAILNKHIASTVPVVPGLGVGNDDRDELLEAAVAVMFRESEDNVLAVLTFRDGQTAKITPKDLVSGAALEKIAGQAVRRAWARAGEGALSALTLEDLLTAADDEFARAARVLSPVNCRGHLSDLPDVDVVAVKQREARPAAPAYRYLRHDEMSETGEMGESDESGEPHETPRADA